jgi:hypothetical protein
MPLGLSQHIENQTAGMVGDHVVEMIRMLAIFEVVEVLLRIDFGLVYFLFSLRPMIPFNS